MTLYASDRFHPVRDLTYVSDTVRGFLCAGQAEAALGQVINLGNGKGISVGELAHTIMQVIGREVPIVQDAHRVRPEASEVRLLLAGTERARKVLGWEPQVPLTDGLQRVIQYVGENMPSYRVGSYSV